MNFTANNLRFKEEMSNSNSTTSISTGKVFSTLLARELIKSSIGPAFIICKVTRLRPVKNGDATGVDLNCTYRNDSAMPQFDRMRMYAEMVNQTQGFTKMGPYRLNKTSLYVDGFHETPPPTTVLPTTPASPGIRHLMMNFTITNLRHKPEMGISDSRTFNSSARVLKSLLDRTLRQSGLIPAFIGCQVISFRSQEGGNHTGVDAVCSYRSDSPVDRKEIYHKTVNSTNGFTEMGPYKLDENSLYVNGYHEAPLQPTLVPTTPTKPTSEQFLVNCTITNLKYKPEMANPSSNVFRSANKTLSTLMVRMLKKTSIGSVYTACNVTALRSMDGGRATGVDSVCTYRSNSTTPPFDRAEVHRDLTNASNGFPRMGPYTLDSNSLRVNGYPESSGFVDVTPAPTTPRTPAVGYITVNCTFTNLAYTRDLGMCGSRKFNATDRVMRHYMEPILKNTSVGPAFIGCQVENFRAAQTGNGVTMNALCSYQKDLLPTPFDHEKVQREMSDMTDGGRRMGRYNIQENSLQVNE